MDAVLQRGGHHELVGEVAFGDGVVRIERGACFQRAFGGLVMLQRAGGIVFETAGEVAAEALMDAASLGQNVFAIRGGDGDAIENLRRVFVCAADGIRRMLRLIARVGDGHPRAREREIVVQRLANRSRCLVMRERVAEAERALFDPAGAVVEIGDEQQRGRVFRLARAHLFGDVERLAVADQRAGVSPRFAR